MQFIQSYQLYVLYYYYYFFRHSRGRAKCITFRSRKIRNLFSRSVYDYRNLKPRSDPKVVGLKIIIIRKSHASVVVIGNLIIAGLRCYPIAWRTFFSRYQTINLRIGGDQAQNVLLCVNNIVPSKSIGSVVIYCSTNKIDTSSSDKFEYCCHS